jgi:hypothetical protein
MQCKDVMHDRSQPIPRYTIGLDALVRHRRKKRVPLRDALKDSDCHLCDWCALHEKRKRWDMADLRGAIKGL